MFNLQFSIAALGVRVISLSFDTATMGVIHHIQLSLLSESRVTLIFICLINITSTCQPFCKSTPKMPVGICTV